MLIKKVCSIQRMEKNKHKFIITTTYHAERKNKKIFSYIYLKNKQIIIINRILFLLLLTTFFIFGLYIKDPQRLEDFYFILMGYGNVNYHGNSFSNAISSFDYSFIPFYGLAALKFKNNLKFLVYFMLLNLVMQYWISPYSLLVFNLLIDDIKKTKKAV